MEFGQFILAHEGDNLGALALAREKYVGEPFDFDLALTTLEVRRKLRDKVPEWYAVPALCYPFRVSGEQCSSSETARYKASVAMQAVALHSSRAESGLFAQTEFSPELKPGENRPFRTGSIADLTGGLGVDSWVFAQVFAQVLYNEMRPELASAAAANFQKLGAENIVVRNQELRPGHVADVLNGFTPDIIFLDPARRAEDGRKVFRLEDCQPDVLQLLPELLSACPLLLLKLSPMADISLVFKQLSCVREVHVVAAEGECKELLLLLERGYEGQYALYVYENNSRLEIPGGGHALPESVATLGLIRGRGPSVRMGGVAKRRFWESMSPSETELLFEPGKALLKAGAFELPCHYGLEKLGRHTHLYVGESVPEELKPFGKVFRILEMLPLNKASFKEIGKRYPQAEVTARNIPLTSEALKAKLKVRSGGSVHIFGLHIDALDGNDLLVCQNS